MFVFLSFEREWSQTTQTISEKHFLYKKNWKFLSTFNPGIALTFLRATQLWCLTFKSHSWPLSQPPTPGVCEVHLFCSTMLDIKINSLNYNFPPCKVQSKLKFAQVYRMGNLTLVTQASRAWPSSDTWHPIGNPVEQYLLISSATS